MKTMKIRDFLRGGYKDITELTVITHHGAPIATWMPQTDMRDRGLTFGYATDIHGVRDVPRGGTGPEVGDPDR